MLSDLAGHCELITDPDLLASYRHDQAAPGLLPAGTPVAVARPISSAEVQAAVRAAARHGIPVVARGAGSGLSGGANAIEGCLVLSLERMTEILEIDTDSLTARVQPGVINASLRAAAADRGLWFAPDPASQAFSTLGGNVATNAGGLCCVKYGVTRDALLGLEVVLADGELVQLGHATRKGVVGYDLTALFCGSEGTLGIITEATFRLLPTPPPTSTLVASFPTLAAAGHAIRRISSGLTPSLLELMDATTVAAVEAMQPMELHGATGALLYARADQGTGDIERMEAWCTEAGAELVVTSDDEAEGRMLMEARRLAYPALERLGATLLDDVCVPIGQIVALLDGVAEIAGEAALTIGVFGHAGDGNMHPTIVYDRHSAAETARAGAAFDAIIALAHRLGGTASGEHGVGALKVRATTTELGPASLRLHHAIKDAVDPTGLFNPGKVLPVRQER